MEKPTSGILRFWQKIPIIIRAIILGFLISTIGVVTWPIVGTVLGLPWGFFAMLFLLWLYLKYFSGSWKPQSTKAFRKFNFRNTFLPKGLWPWALLAILLVVLVEQSVLVFTFRLLDFPAEQFLTEYSFIEGLPEWGAWLVIIMISIVAGVCEEVGFRGYMQVPLEKKYGATAAISIVSVVFVIVHLHQAWSSLIIIHIFFISVMFGCLAYFFQSLIPGIIAHIIMDVFNFSFWWTSLGGQFDKQTIHETGLDNHFIIWTIIMVVGICLFIFVMKRTNKLMQKTEIVN